MSDIRKWINVVSDELFPGQSVKVSDSRGGGIGVVKQVSGDTVLIDVKGSERSVPLGDIDIVIDQDDEYQGSPTNIISPGYIESGDSVCVQDFYGSGTGDAYGIFVSYSHDGQTAIVNIDSEERSIPVDLVYPSKENKAKERFNDLDNDGSKSPMSYNNNEEDSIMDDFEKWMEAVEDGPEEKEIDTCKCGSYDCEKCYPITEDEVEYYGSEDDDYESRVGDNEGEDYSKQADELPDVDSDIPSQDYADTSIDAGELIGQIEYMQNLGMSDSPKHYDIDSLLQMKPEAVLRIYQKVAGEEPMESVGAGGVAVGGDQGKVQDQKGIYEGDIDDESISEFISNAESKKNVKPFSEQEINRLEKSDKLNVDYSADPVWLFTDANTGELLVVSDFENNKIWYVTKDKSEEDLQEGLRKIDRVDIKDCHAKIYRNSEYDEFQVKFYGAAGYEKDADYFTDDLNDAKATAKLQLGRMCSSGDIEEDYLSNKERGLSDKEEVSEEFDFPKLSQEAQDLVAKGVDPEQAVMSLAKEYGFEHDEVMQHELYNSIKNLDSSVDRIKSLSGL